MDNLVVTKYIQFKCRDIDAYIFKIKVKDILPLYYVPVRGRDKEEGAVQRVLNNKRIIDISNYVLRGNMFLNTFILNWSNYEIPLVLEDTILIPKIPNSLQVIDGQHRLEGIKRACEYDERCGENDIIVVLTNRLSTTLAAEVFLNINSEQKQVPKSLVYDLFGEIRDAEYNIDRARELSERINNDIDSPFYQTAKMPGSFNRGKIDFSTMVSSLKDYMKEGGVFEQYDLSNFESQYRALFNYHCVIRNAYGEKWIDNDNPFFTSAGYFAMTKFFVEKIIPACALIGFEQEYISTIMDFYEEELLTRKDIKNQQGKEQRQSIYNYLLEIFTKGIKRKRGNRV